jgi:lipopolysaccharide/colanic/teichoic acid biosynthesis glycosyltransferase
MLLQSGSLLKPANKDKALEKILCALSHSTRQTDIKGWYTDGSVIGVIFTEIGSAAGKPVANALFTKVTNALSSTLTIHQINQISLSFHVFPENSNDQDPAPPADSALYPDLLSGVGSKTVSRMLKRTMDIAGSLSALILSSPLLFLIALVIKLTSRGPILFRQERIGQHGKTFTFLKFRSMYFNNDYTIHKEFMESLISGTDGPGQPPGSQQNSYKLTADPRVTPVGRLLRRTSLDELPQLFNVLTGQMSLVGPRPPIPYELQWYDIWHKQRMLGVKPGITGLWQVQGRSRVKFNEMVRLDLKYARSWSLWMDIKILFRTPKAVFLGEGAY